MPFQNRRQAGQRLANKLAEYHIQNPIVLALPRGGVPVAFEIAKALHAPLDVLAVRKVGAPSHEEFGIGAVTEGGYYWLDLETINSIGATKDQINKILDAQFNEVKRQVKLFRGGRPLSGIKNRTVIVVDDGLATGVTARIAGRYLKQLGAKKIFLAEPVCSPRTAETLEESFDEIICLESPASFYAVGQFYQNFEQVSDEEVASILDETKGINEDISVPFGISNLQGHLQGHLTLPPLAKGLVVFAHGSGSTRFSPRNRAVAKTLNESGLGTFLFDLLTENEAQDRRNVFDIPLLADRLTQVVEWLKIQNYAKDLPIGLFGASTGGGAALWAAAKLKNSISAIVSRGGRADLAIPKLPEVTCPTLLIVSEYDEAVIEMNRQALKYLSHGELLIIPKATHLFEEPGTLEAVALNAERWFTKNFKAEVQRGAA